MGRYTSAVKIPKDKLEKWNILRQEQDAMLIAKEAAVTTQTIYNAFNSGKCQEYVLEAIEAYYEAKINALYENLDQ